MFMSLGSHSDSLPFSMIFKAKEPLTALLVMASLSIKVVMYS